MNSSTFKAVHKYGVILSIVCLAITIFAYVLGNPYRVTALLIFGWSVPLGLFYFGGAYLYNTSTYRILGEELLRGGAWYFLSLTAWSVINTLTTALSATAFAVFGLPALTALVITLVMIATRYATDRELKVQSEDGQLLVTILGGIAWGFLALYLSLSEEWGWWVFGLYLVSIPAGLALWRTMRQLYPDALGVN